MNFTVPADHRIQLKESEKKDKYLDLARELIKLPNMKVILIPIVIGAIIPAYGCKERTKTKLQKQSTRRNVKILTIVLKANK